MGRGYQTPFKSAEQSTRLDSAMEAVASRELKRGTRELRRRSAVLVFILAVVISSMVLVTAHHLSNRLKKWEVRLLWQKVLGEKVFVEGKSRFLSLDNVTYDEQRNLLLLAYSHLVGEWGKGRLELVLEILDATSGRTIQTIVSPKERPTDKPSLSIRSAGYFANPVVVSVPEENTVLLLDRLTLRTYDMSSGAVGASLDLPQREAHWLAVYLPHPNKLFLFDPVRKEKVEKIKDYWNWDYDVFEVEAGKKTIKLKKIVSFRTQDSYTRDRLRVCATCQGRRLIWLRREGEKYFFEVYDPLAEKFDSTVRTLPPHVAPLLADELRAELGLWLDEQDWRWLYIAEKCGKDDKEYVELSVWTNQNSKPLGTLRAPDVEEIAHFAVDAAGTLCAVFGSYTTYVVDINQMRIVAKWTEEKERHEHACFAGVLSRTGKTVFRVLDSPLRRPKVMAYRLGSNDR